MIFDGVLQIEASEDYIGWQCFFEGQLDDQYTLALLQELKQLTHQ